MAITLQSVYSELQDVLDQYDRHVGYGFFTRASRIKITRHLRRAMQEDNPVEVVLTLMKFAESVNADDSDTGLLGQSKLNSLLWADHKRPGAQFKSVYQLTYSWLNTLEETNVIRQAIHQHAHALLSNNAPPQQAPLWERMLRKIGECFGYSWVRGHGLLMRPIPVHR